MSSLFQTVERDAWRAAGGGAQAEKGLYVQLLTDFIETGERYGVIPTENGHFAGKKPASITTALKQARSNEKAPAGAKEVNVNSKGGVIFLENTAVPE
jgi:hypothetical protein